MQAFNTLWDDFNELGLTLMTNNETSFSLNEHNRESSTFFLTVNKVQEKQIKDRFFYLYNATKKLASSKLANWGRR